MFRLVINPKMKNSAVTVINGITNPGEVRAADCLVCVAIEGLLRFLFNVLSPVRIFFLRSGQRPNPERPILSPIHLRFNRGIGALYCTQHYTANHGGGKWPAKQLRGP